MTKTQKGESKRGPSAETINPWPKRLGMGGGFIALVLLIAVVISGTLSEPLGGVPEGTVEVATGDPAHVQGVIYGVSDIPAGGPMASAWGNCGFYSNPMPAENVVHSLEHGAVWVAYQPDLPGSEVDTLRSLARPAEKVLASPIEGAASPITATAWGFQLELDSADDPRLGQFVVEFAGSLTAPEPGGACSGGVGIPG